MDIVYHKHYNIKCIYSRCKTNTCLVKFGLTSMLMAGDPGRLETRICIFPWNPRIPWGQGTLHVGSYFGNPTTREGKTHTYLLSYIWNLVTRGGKERFMYAVNVEAPRHEQGRHTHLHSYLWNLETRGAWHSSCTQLLWKPHNPSREDTPIYLVTFEPRDPWGQGTLHVCSYCGSPATQSGKTHPFT
jgi:hypothetical protein